MAWHINTPDYWLGRCRGMLYIWSHLSIELIKANNRGYNEGFRAAVRCGMKDAEYVDTLEVRLKIAQGEIKELKKSLHN